MQTQKTLFNPTVNGVPIVDYAMDQDDVLITDPIDFMSDSSWAFTIGDKEDFTYSIKMSNDGVTFFPYATISQTYSNNSGDAPTVQSAVNVIGNKMFTDNHFPARYMQVTITAANAGGLVTATICK